jgi:hypothetical protein
VLLLALRALRGRPGLPWGAALVVSGLGLSLGSMGLSDVPTGRSWASADVRILEVSRGLQQSMLDRLQLQGQVPRDEATWRKALAAVAPKPSPARTRSFEPVPYRVVLKTEQGQLPAGVAPGTLVAWVNPAGDAFELTPVGFARDGTVGPLIDEKGEKVVLRGGLAPVQGGAP